jgi:glycosyltransferase involved in cell wall biosynthesis
VISDPGILNTVRSTYGLPENYIFWPTSLSPRKNSDRVLDAFTDLLDKIPQQLVITGGKAWKAKPIIKRINSEFPERIKILGNVPQDHMAALYRLANFTIYPSLLEGFGFPILESFRCGRAILTSNLASMPEIAGEAAFLVDPYSAEEISAGILRLATDETLRHALEEKGFERAKFFSWQQTAEGILAGLVR